MKKVSACKLRLLPPCVEQRYRGKKRATRGGERRSEEKISSTQPMKGKKRSRKISRKERTAVGSKVRENKKETEKEGSLGCKKDEYDKGKNLQKKEVKYKLGRESKKRNGPPEGTRRRL